MELNRNLLNLNNRNFGSIENYRLVKTALMTYRSIFFCADVISSTLVLRKQRNTLRYDTVEVEN